MNRHGTDVVSLTFGSMFLGVVAVWLLARLVHIDLPSFGWFVAVALVLLGVLGVVLTVRQSRR